MGILHDHLMPTSVSQFLYLLSESISTVTFFPMNLCRFPILKPRVLRKRRSLREQYPLEIVTQRCDDAYYMFSIEVTVSGEVILN